jgi:hypothetical protein
MMPARMVEPLRADLVPVAGFDGQEDGLPCHLLPGPGGDVSARLLLQEPGVLIEIRWIRHGGGDGWQDSAKRWRLLGM